MKKTFVVLLVAVLAIVLSAQFFAAYAADKAEYIQGCPAKHPLVTGAGSSANGTTRALVKNCGNGEHVLVKVNTSALPQGDQNAVKNKKLFDLQQADKVGVLVRMLLLMIVPLINLFIVSWFNKGKST